MEIILAKTVNCDIEPLKPILRVLGDAVPEKVACGETSSHATAPSLSSLDDIGGFEHLGERLASNPDTWLLAFHEPPEVAIGRAIEQPGKSLEDAISEWTDSARQLLATVRHNRQRTKLFDASIARTQTSAFEHRLGEAFGLQPTGASVPDVHVAQAVHGELCCVIAAQVVAQSQELEDLRDELEARAIPISRDAPERAFDCRRALAELRNAVQTREHASEENELLTLQLHQVQEELETYYLNAKKLTTELDKLREQKDKLDKEVACLSKDRDRQRRILNDIKNSRSWKLTAPLRRFRHTTIRGRKQESGVE